MPGLKTMATMMFLLSTLVCFADPPPPPNQPGAAPAPHDVLKNRYLSFSPNNTESVGFLLELTASDYFGASVGSDWWVDEPVLINGRLVARLRETPVYRVWTESVVHIGDCPVVPAAHYDLLASPDGEVFSTPLALSTIDRPGARFWCDVVGSFIDDVWTQPNGVVNFDDTYAAILGFQGAPNAAHWTRLDVEPERPNAIVNINDVFQIILAFQGDPYPYIAPAACVLTNRSPSGGDIDFLVTADTDLIEPDDPGDPDDSDSQVVIDVSVEPASDVGAYEVSLEVTGGTTGSLELTAMNIDKSSTDYVFGSSSVVDAVDDVGGRLGAAMSDGTGVTVTTANDYLGTFMFLASSDASGVFEFRVKPIKDAYLSDSTGTVLGTSPGDVLLVGVGVDCMNDGHCDDSSECTDDACVGNVCQYTNNNCDDSNACTTDTCNAGVCEHSSAPSGTPCDDGQFCTTPDTCDGAGICVGGAGDPCLRNETCIEFNDTCIPTQGGAGT